MFSMSMATLPDLTPRDPHNLWYTSRHAPATIPHHLLNPSSAAHHDHHHHHHHHTTHAGLGAAAATNAPYPRDRDHRRALVERTPLARLRHDEALMDRRRANVSNYGSWWLKPPGVPKTLFQMREERREQEEQAEALRREAQLQAQLAQAGLSGEDEQMMEGEDEVVEQDLDDEIPEAEGFGFDGEDSAEEEQEDETAGDEEETEEIVEEDEEETVGAVDSGDHAGAVLVTTPVQEIRDLRAAEDRVREMIARRQEEDYDASEVFPSTAAGGAQTEQMLEEDDLEPGTHDAPDMNADISLAMDMDMDADLDEGIPEGGEDEYEHTDSDEDIGDDLTQEISFVGRSSGSLRPPHNRRLRRSMPRSSMRSSNRASLLASDMDISGFLSGDGSSFVEGSPHMRRRQV